MARKIVLDTVKINFVSKDNSVFYLETFYTVGGDKL